MRRSSFMAERTSTEIALRWARSAVSKQSGSSASRFGLVAAFLRCNRKETAVILRGPFIITI